LEMQVEIRLEMVNLSWQESWLETVHMNRLETIVMDLLGEDCSRQEQTRDGRFQLPRSILEMVDMDLPGAS
jgi:hypothetical protein